MEQAARSGVLDQVVAGAALVAAEGTLGLGVEDAVADVEAAAEQPWTRECSRRR